MKNLLIIVDMINGFVNEGNLADKKINRIVEDLTKQVEKSIKDKDMIIAFKDTHEQNDIEFESYPVHCVKGSPECALIPELKVFENYMTVIEKSTTNGFIEKAFKSILEKNIFDKIIVTGADTDICVFQLVESLINYIKEQNLKTIVVVPENMVDTFDNDNHNAEEMNKTYIQKMEKLGAKILK